MPDFQELRPLPQPRRVADLAPQAKTYKSFKAKALQNETSRVMSMSFCPTAPHRLAVVSGTKVGLWKPSQNGGIELDGTISKFKDITQCASWRSDGKLLLAGEAGGSCAVIESESKKVLRRLRGHGDAVTCACFASSDKTRAATGGRDGKLRIWDVTTCDLLHTIDAHNDCMKFLGAGLDGPDSWVSAGYDGKMKVWDLRDGAASKPSSGKAKTLSIAPAMCMDHGHPIETAVAFPGGAMFASGGGPVVRLWDLAAGGRIVQALPDAHSKAVTALCLDSKASVLLSGSFDCFAKVWHVAGFEHLYTFRMPTPVVCAAWRPDDKAFALGLDDGTWQLREYRTEADKAAASKRAAELANAEVKKTIVQKRKAFGNLRGMDKEAASDDEVIEEERPKRKKKESQLDFFLRKFEYRKAAEVLVKPSTSASQGFALVDELIQRGALQSALRDRDESFCLAALKWLLKSFATGDALHQRLFFEMLHALLDTNQCLQPPNNQELVAILTNLDAKVAQEISVQEALTETAGMLNCIMSL